MSLFLVFHFYNFIFYIKIKMSTGELTVIPEVIYLTNEKLKRRLKRSPTDQELATALNMSHHH